MTWFRRVTRYVGLWASGKVPGRLSAGDDIGRIRFLVRIWGAGIFFSVALTVTYASAGLKGQTVYNAFLAVFGIGVLWALRLGARLAPLVHASLTVPQVAIALGALAQRPFDVSNVFILALFPLFASMLGARWTLLYLGTSLTLGLGSLAMGVNGYSLAEVDPEPRVGTVVNYAMVTVLVSLGGLGVHELRRVTVQAVVAASRAKSAFLANMSHEIRTPMNGVLGLTEVMLADPLPPHQRERLELIHRSGELLVNLINDLLDLSRVQAGKMPLHPEDVALVRLPRDVQQLFEATAEEKHLSLELDLDPGLPHAVQVDPLRLRQVLSNLVSNAVKFTDRGGVRLAVYRNAGRVRFEVQDTGLGISREQQGRLFQAFEQANYRSERRGAGSGLGLALSQELVNLLGGVLLVESQPGEGSRFFFDLELPDANTPAPLPEVVRRVLASRRVLVVDDNPINLKVARALAEKAGYRVSTATGGREAVEAIARGAYDVVLMDCHMPDVDGFEATRCIRGLPGENAKVRIIALTASALPEDVSACFAAKMDGCLSKPISMARLIDAIESPGPVRPVEAPVVA